MNWKRGLLRLWLIVSLLWFLAAGGIAVVVSSKQQQRGIRPTAAEIEDCKKKGPVPEFLSGCGDSRIEYVTVWELPPWQFLAGIVVAPIVLLGFGAAGYWAAQGFKPPN